MVMKRSWVLSLVLAMVMVFSTSVFAACSDDKDLIANTLNRCEDFSGFEMNGKASMLGIEIDVKLLQQGFKVRIEYKLFGITNYVLNDGEYTYTWTDVDTDGKKSPAGESADLLSQDYTAFKEADVAFIGNEVLGDIDCERYSVKVDDSTSFECLLSSHYGTMMMIDNGFIKMDVVQIEEVELPSDVLTVPANITFN